MACRARTEDLQSEKLGKEGNGKQLKDILKDWESERRIGTQANAQGIQQERTRQSHSTTLRKHNCL